MFEANESKEIRVCRAEHCTNRFVIQSRIAKVYCSERCRASSESIRHRAVMLADNIKLVKRIKSIEARVIVMEAENTRLKAKIVELENGHERPRSRPSENAY